MTEADADRKPGAAGGGIKLGLGWGAIVFVGGSLLTLLFCWGLHADIAIAYDGLEVDGVVVGVRSTGTKVMGVTVSEIKFRYTLSSTAEAEAGAGAGTGPLEGLSATTDDDVLESATPGQSVRVEVARGNPRWARIKGTTVSSTGYVGIAVLLFPLAGLVLMARGAVSAIRGPASPLRSPAGGPDAGLPAPDVRDSLPDAAKDSTAKDSTLPSPAPAVPAASDRSLSTIAAVTGCLFPIGAVVLLVVAASLFLASRRFAAEAGRAEGVVFDFESSTYTSTERDSGGRSVTRTRSVEHPLVKYQVGGRTYELKGSGSSNSGYFEGDRVTVLFRPDDPEDARIESFREQYLPAVVALGAGFCLLVIGLGARWAAGGKGQA